MTTQNTAAATEAAPYLSVNASASQNGCSSRYNCVNRPASGESR